MLAALKLASQIFSLGNDSVALVIAIVNLVRGHDTLTQRVALDAALGAAEDVIAKRVHGGK